MGWSRQKAIASWQRCRSRRTCCLCVALPLQPEGCSRADGAPRGPRTRPRRAQRPAAAGGFPPARGEETASAPHGGKESAGSPIHRWLSGFASASPRGRDGDAGGAPRQPAAEGAPRRAAAAPRRRLRHRPEHPRCCPSAAAAAGTAPARRPPRQPRAGDSQPPAPPAGSGRGQTRSQQWACLQQHDLT